jgi:hypothetical protein
MHGHTSAKKNATTNHTNNTKERQEKIDLFVFIRQVRGASLLIVTLPFLGCCNEMVTAKGFIRCQQVWLLLARQAEEGMRSQMLASCLV